MKKILVIEDEPEMRRNITTLNLLTFRAHYLFRPIALLVER